MSRHHHRYTDRSLGDRPSPSGSAAHLWPKTQGKRKELTLRRCAVTDGEEAVFACKGVACRPSPHTGRDAWSRGGTGASEVLGYTAQAVPTSKVEH